MKNIKLIKIKVVDNKNILLDLDQKSFCRIFDCPFKNVQEVEKHLSKSVVFLIKEYNLTIGYCSYETKVNHVHISGVVMLPKFQGKGIGTFVMKKLLTKLKAYNKISLTVHPKNVTAVKLYYNFGFIVTGWKDNYFGDGQPRLILEKAKSK